MGTKTNAAALAVVVAAFVAPMEGLLLKAERDIARPEIWNICYGDTDAKKGQTATPEECALRLRKYLESDILALDKLLPDLPDNRRFAYADAGYNLGRGIWTRRSCARRSEDNSCAQWAIGTSIVELERAGKWQSACARLLLFDYAGGKKYPGLTKRRQQEYRICLGN